MSRRLVSGLYGGRGFASAASSPPVVGATAAEIVAALMTVEIEGGHTFGDILRLLLSALANNGIIPLGDGSFEFNSVDGGKVRIGGKVEGVKRTNIVLDGKL